MRILTCLAVCGSALFLGGNCASAQTKNIDLQLVKYDGLKQAVLKNRGKVVIVDFWGEF